MGTFLRVRSILSKVISVLVILLSLALTTFVWIIQDNVSSSAVAIFAEVDNISQFLRNGIARVEPEIRSLRLLIGQVETASEEIAQNISEDGIIARLLPQTLTDRLTNSSQALRDNFSAVYDLLAVTSDLLLALDSIPFVDIPEKGLSTIATLRGSMEELTGQVESLKENVSDVRAEAGTRISQVTDASAFLGAEVDQFRSDLSQINTDLEVIQISVRKYRRITPTVVITTGIILSLLSGWVIYSQVIMFLRTQKPDHENIPVISENRQMPLDEGRDE
jgi:hypothetical protein